MRDVTKVFFDKHFGVVADDVKDTFIETYISEWNRGIILYPQMKTFLRRLKRKYRLSIISNTHYPSLVHRNVKAMGVEDLIDHVVTSVEYGIPKPDEKIFHHTVNLMGCTPETTVHIGDSYNDDYKGATGAGIRSILLDSSYKWKDAEDDRVESIFDIERLL